MSVVVLGAERIRRAAVDIEEEHDLDLIVRADDALRRQITEPLVAGELGWLAPHEWQWFAEWRTRWGAPIDLGLIEYLDRAAGSNRFARHRVRRLVMTDPPTIEMASALLPDGRFADGLRWLDRDAESAARVPVAAVDLVVDALQVASPASWRSLRVLVSSHGDGGPAARDFLLEFAEQRRLSQDITALWFR